MTKTITLAELEDVSFSGLTAEEKETSINWYYGDKTAVLSTSDNTVLTKLKKVAKATMMEWYTRTFLLKVQQTATSFLRQALISSRPFREILMPQSEM